MHKTVDCALHTGGYKGTDNEIRSREVGGNPVQKRQRPICAPGVGGNVPECVLRVTTLNLTA